MIGLNNLHVKPPLVSTIGAIDGFKGLWNGLDDHTTGLHLMSDVATLGAQLQPFLETLVQEPLTPELLQSIHKVWTKDGKGGHYKTSNSPLIIFDGQDQREVGSLPTADFEEAPILFAKLVEWTDEALLSDDYHPLLVIAIFTAVFLQISPFSTDNMRLAQFLVVVLMMKADYRYAPFTSFEIVFNEYGKEVFEALNLLQISIETGNPDWHGWLECFIKILKVQSDVLCHHIEDERQAQAISGMPKLSLAMLEILRLNKRVTMKMLMTETKGRRSTIKLRMSELISQGLVKRHGAGRGVWYSMV